MNRSQAARAAVTYPLAGLTAAITAMATTLPFHGPTATAVWIATVAPVGYATTVLADRITFHRRGGAA